MEGLVLRFSSALQARRRCDYYISVHQMRQEPTRSQWTSSIIKGESNNPLLKCRVALMSSHKVVNRSCSVEASFCSSIFLWESLRNREYHFNCQRLQISCCSQNLLIVPVSCFNEAQCCFKEQWVVRLHADSRKHDLRDQSLLR